jgi:hypothetical protein
MNVGQVLRGCGDVKLLTPREECQCPDLEEAGADGAVPQRRLACRRRDSISRLQATMSSQKSRARA